MTSGLAEKKDALCRAVHMTALCWAELTGSAGQAEQRTDAG